MGQAGQTDYLVIGILGSEDWIHTSYGRKIEKAIEIKQKGFNVAIIQKITGLMLSMGYCSSYHGKPEKGGLPPVPRHHSATPRAG